MPPRNGCMQKTQIWLPVCDLRPAARLRTPLSQCRAFRVQIMVMYLEAHPLLAQHEPEQHHSTAGGLCHQTGRTQPPLQKGFVVCSVCFVYCTCANVFLCVRVCMCTCVCMHVCVCTCVCVRVHVCVSAEASLDSWWTLSLNRKHTTPLVRLKSDSSGVRDVCSV